MNKEIFNESYNSNNNYAKKTSFISILRNRSGETVYQHENPNTVFICNLEKTSKLKKLYTENKCFCEERKQEKGITGKAWRERRHWRG